MPHSLSTGWLDVGIQENSKFAALDHGQLGRAIAELPHAETQYPAVCVFLGGISRERALQWMFQQNNIKRHASSAAINLRCDIRSIDAERPIIFADSGILPPSCVALEPGMGQSTTWNCQSADDLWIVLLTRVVFPLTDVICIIIEDLSELDLVINLLSRFTPCGDLGSSAWLLPRLIISFGSGVGKEQTASLHPLYERLQAKGQGDRPLVSEIHATNFPEEDLSPPTRFDLLRRTIVGQMDSASEIRDSNLGRRNGRHLSAFFKAAFCQMLVDIDCPFNPLKAMRIERPLCTGIEYQLVHYLETGAQAGLHPDELAPSIASAVLMDHYVPGNLSNILILPLTANIRWLINWTLVSNPRLVFSTLYQTAVLSAFRSSNTNKSKLFAEEHSERVFRSFATMFDQLAQIGCSSVELRKTQMAAQSGRLSRIRSTQICVHCILNSAQHVLACGHTLCDRCAQVFGTPHEFEYRFMVKGCLYCLYQRPMIVDILPPTSTPSILAIDGGGVRGVIPLEFLLLVHESLAPCVIQDVVDLALGTSSGKERQMQIPT